ncbi:MAG: hypothetical protein EOP06_04475 [Proteobacteria bacterium]|nr:MAG: hypothetical protein EOP06_04475 [Pseudomonadota bacterium]
MSENPLKRDVIAMRFTLGQRAQFDELIRVSGASQATFFANLVQTKPLIFDGSSLDLRRHMLIFERVGYSINQVAHQINAAFYRGTVHEQKLVHWFNQLVSCHGLLVAVVSSLLEQTQRSNSSIKEIRSPSDPSLKSVVISFRLNPVALAPIKVVATKASLSVGMVCRELILNEAPIFKPPQDLKKRMIFIANKTNNNIAQLAQRSYTAYQRGLMSYRLHRKWLDLLAAIESLLQAGIEHAD